MYVIVCYVYCPRVQKAYSSDFGAIMTGCIYTIYMYASVCFNDWDNVPCLYIDLCRVAQKKTIPKICIVYIIK